jgi:hypothetical protein
MVRELARRLLLLETNMSNMRVDMRDAVLATACLIHDAYPGPHPPAVRIAAALALASKLCCSQRGESGEDRGSGIESLIALACSTAGNV